MHNACLSFDNTKVICDFGTYHLTGAELNDPQPAIQAGAIKCKAAYDSDWYMRRHWLDRLTAATDLTA